MKIVTVINDTTDFGFNLLRLSCALNNLQLIVLVTSQSNFTNRLKDELLEDYLTDTDNDELIFFSDGNDAVMMAQEKEIVEKFERANSQLIFSAETNCWPDIAFSEKYPRVDSPYRYLNSGGFMGRAGFIKDLLKDKELELEKFKRSNQYLWSQRYFKSADKITLDTRCEIFLTFTPPETFFFAVNTPEYFSSLDEWFQRNFSINGSRIFNKITRNIGCHAHFNGFSKALMINYAADIIYRKIPNFREAEILYEE